MAFFLLVVLSVMLLYMILWGFREPGRIYEFPFLAGAVFIGFILVQLIGLIGNEHLPSGALEKTIAMSILCAAMCYTGYVVNKKPLKSFLWVYDEKLLLIASGALTIIGAYFFWGISRLSVEFSVGLWSGLPVAYLFFAKVLTYGFAMACILYFRSGSIASLIIMLTGILFYFDRIVIAGRRGTLVEFVFIILLALWFQRKKPIPRPAMAVILVVGILFLHSAGQYRSIMVTSGGAEWREIVNINFTDNIKKIVTRGGVEVTNTAFNIEAYDRMRNFDFGLFHWNGFVHNYVPGQLVGNEFKESLMLDLDHDLYETFMYEPTTGSTHTGMSDAFGSFWYFGALKFFIIGYIMSKLYKSAMMGNETTQLFYMLILGSSLHAITHNTQWFLSPWIHMGFFLLPALYFSTSFIFKYNNVKLSKKITRNNC
jgi:hypothetical protein